MRRHLTRWHLLAAWLNALVTLGSMTWPQLSAEPFPLRKFWDLSGSPLGWPVVVASIVLALFLSFPRLHSRARLFFAGAVTLGIAAGVSWEVSMGGGAFFLFMAGEMLLHGRGREDRKGRSAEHSPRTPG
jgi:hypothetical protein